MQVRVEADAGTAARSAARFVARSLTGAVRRRGRASLAVSGGSTPAAMFDALTELAVPWHAVTVFQVDERIAPDGDPARNAGQLRTHLVDAVGLGPAQVRWMPVTAGDVRRAARRYGNEIAAAETIDVVHLGLGDDGHTASWPPGDAVVDSMQPVDVCGPFNGWRRMTLTPGPVNAARRRVLLVAGATKAPMLARYLAGDMAIPATRVRRGGTIVFADSAAAARVHPR